MYILELDVHHEGCWGSEIGVRFPGHHFSSVDCRWIGRHVAHALQVTGDGKKFADIVRYLQRRADVSKVETLSKGKTRLHLRVLTRKTAKSGQFSDTFFAHGCFPIAPTRFVKTSEIWVLGSATKKNLLAVAKTLNEKHPARIRSLKKEELSRQLTPKQREALNHAQLLGYYEWPRKISVTDISKVLRIPKTVLLSHLRKAEQKIIAEYVNRP